MTVLDATQKLLEFFVKNDAFAFEPDFKKICLISDTDADFAAVEAALDAFVTRGILIKKDIKERSYWVLIKPLGLQNQEISIPLSLSVLISATLNKLDPNGMVSNPLAINDQDILALLLMSQKT